MDVLQLFMICDAESPIEDIADFSLSHRDIRESTVDVEASSRGAIPVYIHKRFKCAQSKGDNTCMLHYETDKDSKVGGGRATLQMMTLVIPTRSNCLTSLMDNCRSSASDKVPCGTV
ncbi:hypothetical protein PV327_000603 [Microctonus hyperodae]|uniref:Uncharacterized protein n=1 Tax=Microctonus hyperodae TaxID=165561 RepID=A0AA39G6I0_MICHY|nr:hypothetical protein PV327_000603 [Microctonus hyperodae]